jgi:hypothetical protein
MKNTAQPEWSTQYEVVTVSSGPDWHGRYGRRPEPTFERPRKESRRDCAKTPVRCADGVSARSTR